MKIRLRPDSLEQVRTWAEVLNVSRRDEALATLRDETVVFEAAFLDRTGDGDFLVYVMKAESFDRAKRAAVASLHALDAYHRQFKQDVWLERQELELLVDLDRIAELREGPP